MDKLEQTVARERTSQSHEGNGSSDLPFDAGIDHPALKEHADRMRRAYQREIQKLKDKERDFDRQLHQFAILQQQQSAQQQAAGPRGSAPTTDEYDWLDPEVKPLLSQPDATPLRALVRSFDQRIKSAQPNDSISQMQKTIESLQQQLAQTKNEFVQERYMRQIPDFRKKYGSALDEDQQRAILEYAVGQGVDLERALFAVSPETALAQQRAIMEAELRQKYDAEYGAALEGFDDIKASTPNPNQSPFDKSTGRLESFKETALRELGKGGYAAAARDGFAREEAVTEGE